MKGDIIKTDVLKDAWAVKTNHWADCTANTLLDVGEGYGT